MNKINIKKPSSSQNEDTVSRYIQQTKSSTKEQKVDIDDIFVNNTNNKVKSVNSQMGGLSLNGNSNQMQEINLISFDNTPSINNFPEIRQGNPSNSLINNLDSLYSNNNNNQFNLGYNGLNNAMINQNSINPMSFYQNQYKYNQQQLGFNINNINNINNMGHNGITNQNNMNNLRPNMNLNQNIDYRMYSNPPFNMANNNFVNNSGMLNNNNNVNVYNNSATNQNLINKQPKDDDFTGFDDGIRNNNNQYQYDGSKPLSKLLDPKLVNLESLKGKIHNN